MGTHHLGVYLFFLGTHTNPPHSSKIYFFWNSLSINGIGSFEMALWLCILRFYGFHGHSGVLVGYGAKVPKIGKYGLLGMFLHKWVLNVIISKRDTENR